MKRIFRAYKKTVSIVNETAIGLYEGLAKEKKGFLLESYDKNNGRYTFFGIEPEEIVTSKGKNLVIKKKDGHEEVLEGNPVERLKEYYSEFEVRTDGSELAFTGGLVGSLGYDFIRYTEELPDDNVDEIGIETIQFMLATSFIVIDHVAETLTGVVLEEDSEEGRTRGEGKSESLIKNAIDNMVVRENKFDHDGVIVKKSDSIEQYGEKVEKIKHYIREGHIFQTVLSQRWTIETKQTGFDLYRELRLLNPSPYLYYFNFGEFEVIGSSPEMLVKQVDNKVYTCPIAGSRRRGKDAEEDQLLKDELLRDEKERAEHVMLVDLARNDMGRIAEFGSVKVTQFMEVQNYSHVMHIVSLVEGKKKGEYHPLDLIASFLPAGTLSGYIDFNGNMDFCITIRTMIKKGNMVYLQAGAGIVADSVPESEYMECCNKVMALAKTLVEEERL
jgi:anthranilate synthase component 1